MKNQDLFREIANSISQAKEKILIQFIEKSNLQRRGKNIFLKGTDLKLSKEITIAKHLGTGEMIEVYYFSLPESKEPIHTLGIKINIQKSATEIIPIFDKEVIKYLENKSVRIIRKSK